MGGEKAFWCWQNKYCGNLRQTAQSMLGCQWNVCMSKQRAWKEMSDYLHVMKAEESRNGLRSRRAAIWIELQPSSEIFKLLVWSYILSYLLVKLKILLQHSVNQWGSSVQHYPWFAWCRQKWKEVSLFCLACSWSKINKDCKRSLE